MSEKEVEELLDSFSDEQLREYAKIGVMYGSIVIARLLNQKEEK